MRFGLLFSLTMLGGALSCGGRYERDPQQESAAAGQPVRPPAAGNGGSEPVAASPCSEQAQAYASYRQQVLDEFSSEECATDEECLTIYFPTSCDNECFLLKTAARRPVVDRLNSYVTANCSGACSMQVGVCGPPPPPRCAAGRCI